MPHTIVEHSFAIKKSQINILLLEINRNISKNEGNFDISQCKARSVFCPNFIFAGGALPQDFMHITIKIMSGRSIEIRKGLAENLLKIVKQFLTTNKLSNHPISLSIDVSDIEREIYQKTVITN